jgi:biopolymer transport protein ExbD
MKLERRSLTDSTIPTASMSDIAFLLIIFFMVTAVFSATKGLDMRLPRHETDASPDKVDPGVLIEVLPDQIRVDCRRMNSDEILPYLEPRLTQNPTKPVILYADPQTEYRRMVEIYDLLIGTRSGESKWSFRVREITVPTRSDIEEYVRIWGSNPLTTRCQ